MMSKIVSILGVEYKIFYRTSKEDKTLEENDGYCDFSSKEIVISLDEGNIHDHERHNRRTLRHEIVHAFLYESGLDVNGHISECSWARNEEMIDWIAIQGEKIYKAWSEVNALD